MVEISSHGWSASTAFLRVESLRLLAFLWFVKGGEGGIHIWQGDGTGEAGYRLAERAEVRA